MKLSETHSAAVARLLKEMPEESPIDLQAHAAAIAAVVDHAHKQPVSRPLPHDREFLEDLKPRKEK